MENYIIRDEKDHFEAMQKISILKKKGEKKLTDKKAEKLRLLTAAVELYKNKVSIIPAPATLEEIVELKMYEHKLKQKDLAALLGIGAAKLSQIMSKKRRPDVAFLKALHEKLGIDGNSILKHVV